MKKYILSMVVAIVAILSSCSNDDITITTSYTFNVNASGVVKPFIEATDGELEKFEDANDKVRIRLLIYNANGELVAQESNYYSNYNTQLKASKLLAAGNYTVIGISDVVVMSGNKVDIEFWKLSGESKLSEMKILDQNLIGLAGRILGIAKYSLTIGDNQSSSLDVDLQPAGALVYSLVWKAGGWSYGGSKTTEWHLWGNKSTEGLSFDAFGNYIVMEEYDPETPGYIMGKIEAVEGDFHQFNYVLPMNNLYVHFVAITEGGYVDMADYSGREGTTLNIKAGEEYAFHLNMYERKTYYKKVTSKSDLQYPGSSSYSRTLSSPQKNLHVDKLAPMPKTLYNQTKHVLTAAEVEFSN